jgi:small-conductance mechanosensitive channel/CRP-like cAMP-binding protein
MPAWLSPVVFGLLTAIALLAVGAALVRLLPRQRPGPLLLSWALASGLAVALTLAPSVPSTALSWRLTTALAVLLGVLVVFSWFEAGVLLRPWAPEGGALLPKLVRDVCRIGLLVAGFLWSANQIFGAQLSTLLVSSTVLSAVVGLALQPTLANIFAGMSLQIERPFGVGDWLMVDGQLARVEEMTWRATRLRTNDGVELFEPNGSLAAARLQNYGSGAQPVAFQFDVSAEYDAPPAVVKAALLAAARDCPAVAAEPAPEAFLVGFGESGVQYRLRVWTHEVRRFNPLRDEVNSRIWYRLQRARLAIPVPIRTVLVRSAEAGDKQRREADIARSVQLLTSLELFDDLPVEAQRQLAAVARRELYDDGETLVREGEPGDSLFVIEEGRVRISKSGEAIGTGTIDLAQMQAGDFFGEMSLLTGEPRSATVTALGGCRVLVLTKEALLPVMTQDPDLARVLSAALAARRAEAAATVADRQDRSRTRREVTAESLLSRIRTFFRLPGA